MKKYCSNCFQKTTFKLSEKNIVQRNIYSCNQCQLPSVECSVPKCDAMALASEDAKIPNMFCAEHNGSILNFETANLQIDSLTEYDTIMKRRSVDAGKILKTAAVGALPPPL